MNAWQRSPKVLRHLLARDIAWAAAVFVACLALYLPTLSPSIVAGDGGEFQMLARALGVPHPTGYPLYMLLSWAATHLPLGGDVAYRVTLLGTVTAAASMAVVSLLLRELGVRPALAALSALLLASAPRLWMHATAAEVYPLAVLLWALGSWLLLRWGRGRLPLWAPALVFGLGLTHHISLRLVGPAVVVYLLLVEPRLPLRARRWLPALGALLLPLALYAYIPWRATHFLGDPAFQGEIATVPKVVAAGYVSPFYGRGDLRGYVLASRYARDVLSSAGLGWDVLADYLGMLRHQFPLQVVGPGALLGLGALLRHRMRAGLYFLLAYLVTTWAALRFLSLVGEDGNQFIPAYVVTAVWFACGAEALARRWSQRAWAPGAVTGLVALTALGNVVWHAPEAWAARQVAVRPEAEAILAQPLPPGAAIAGRWDDVTPLRYLQRIDGRRPDLWVLHADEVGIQTRILPAALAEGVPLYVLRPTQAGPPLLPLPLVERPDVAQTADLALAGAARWRGADLPLGPVAPGAALPVTLYWQAEAPIPQAWTTFIHLLDGRGERVAQVDRVPLETLYPPTAWQPGQWLADPYDLPLPADLPPGRYRLLFGGYRAEGRLIWEDGRDAQPLGEVEVGLEQ